LTCPTDHSEMIKRQILAYYPYAVIDVVPNHNIFDIQGNESQFVSCAGLRANKRFIYPIKTYKNLDVDALNGLTNSISKLGMHSSVAIQIQIKPISDRWRIYSALAAREVLEGKTNYIHSNWKTRFLNQTQEIVLNYIAKSGSKDGGASGGKSWRQTPVQDDLMKAFNDKASKPGFKTYIRIVSVSDEKSVAENHRENIISSFSQFNASAWNSFIPIRYTINNYRVVKNFILRIFENKYSMILNSEEIASIFHLPTRFVETPNIQWLQSRTLPAPANLPTEGIIIGESIHRGEKVPVKIKDEDRRRHIFMIGKTGVGKTTLFENMVDQDIRNGKGIVYLDPNGDAVQSILEKIPKERAEDVIYFDPANTENPMGLNLLEWSNDEEKDFLIAEWLEMFYKLYDPNKTGIIGPQFEHWGRNAALTVMSLPEGGTLIDIPRLFTDDQFRERAIKSVQDPIIRAFWQEQLAKTADFHKSEMYNYFISKFGRFMTNKMMRNIIGQSKSAFDIRKIMDEGKILLVNLSKGELGEMNSYLLGMVLVSKIQSAAFSRANIPETERKDFYLYVDEFQNFTTDSFATILSEARKYRLSLNVTNQYIAQLTEKIRDAVIGNAGTLICYRIGAGDAEYMVKEFPGVTIDDMVNLDKYTTYTKLLIDLTPSKPFTMHGVLSPIEKNQTMKEAIVQLSNLKYTHTKNEIEKILNKRYEKEKIDKESGINVLE
ncbi:hypothetical protein CO100_00635, partial [Candidatus Berkelbacteria bacterium CG_4_9_14_3_um_filter_33_5]